jgi:hypothetical protein
MDDILGALRAAWGWRGFEPSLVVDQNKFGNIIFLDTRGEYWRLCPEELSCVVIARTESEYLKLKADPEFISDWTMASLVEAAEGKFGGPQPAGRCFCLKMPGVLGGAYALQNIGTISISESIRFSGDIARQIKDLPDGAKITFKLSD